MTYQLNFSFEGGQTALISKLEGGVVKLVWALPLKEDDEVLLFASFYNEDCFILLNDEGWVRTYSVSQQCCLQEK